MSHLLRDFRAQKCCSRLKRWVLGGMSFTNIVIPHPVAIGVTEAGVTMFSILVHQLPVIHPRPAVPLSLSQL